MSTSNIHTLHIKHMVCQRCIDAVSEILNTRQIEVLNIDLGKVEICADLNQTDWSDLKKALMERGFGLIEDKDKQLVDQIKTAIIQMIHQSDKTVHVKNSVYLSQQLGINYGHLSRIFSQHMQITIEKYVILQKVEKIKEWISYQEMTLSEMAYKLGYKNLSHLSAQFKSATGMSISEFKKLPKYDRTSLDEIGENK